MKMKVHPKSKAVNRLCGSWLTARFARIMVNVPRIKSVMAATGARDSVAIPKAVCGNISLH